MFASSTDHSAWYYTTFNTGTANPISEGGRWVNGGTTGLDWSDVQISGGVACGTQTNSQGTIGPPYNDSSAVLTGTWPKDQEVICTVFSQNQDSAGGHFQEVEILLRHSITANINRGYEVLWRCTSDGSQYLDVVRWDGALNNFDNYGGATHKVAADGLPGITNGCQVRATIIGNTITAYQRATPTTASWTQIIAWDISSDTNKWQGNPGMGFWNRATGTAANTDYGFTMYNARGL